MGFFRLRRYISFYTVHAVVAEVINCAFLAQGAHRILCSPDRLSVCVCVGISRLTWASCFICHAATPASALPFIITLVYTGVIRNTLYANRHFVDPIDSLWLTFSR